MKRVSNKTILKRLKRGVLCCPTCGSTNISSHYHSVAYPEMWHEYLCCNCGLAVAYIDNSPYTSVLDEIEENKLRSIKSIRAMHRTFYNNSYRLKQKTPK